MSQVSECRICLETFNSLNLLQPCQCKGSHANMCHDCLHQMYLYYGDKCLTCKTKYTALPFKNYWSNLWFYYKNEFYAFLIDTDPFSIISIMSIILTGGIIALYNYSPTLGYYLNIFMVTVLIILILYITLPTLYIILTLIKIYLPLSIYTLHIIWSLYQIYNDQHINIIKQYKADVNKYKTQCTVFDNRPNRNILLFIYFSLYIISAPFTNKSAREYINSVIDISADETLRDYL